VNGVETIVRIGLTRLAATARKTDAVVTDVSRVHDAALPPFGDSACCNLNLGVPTNVLVEDLGAMKHGFGNNTVGLRMLVECHSRWSFLVGPL
jgi:hypothetical protein